MGSFDFFPGYLRPKKLARSSVFLDPAGGFVPRRPLYA